METQFMGLLIACISTLLGIASIVVAIIIKPIINLNKTITKLNDTIDQLNEKNGTLNERVTIHGKEIDDVQKHLVRHDTDIEYLKKGITNK